jgi:hypothetical protein
MTVEEQRDCLEAAGFGTVTNLLEMHGMVLQRAVHQPMGSIPSATAAHR